MSTGDDPATPLQRTMLRIRSHTDNFLRELATLARYSEEEGVNNWSEEVAKVGAGLKEQFLTQVEHEIDTLISHAPDAP